MPAFLPHSSLPNGLAAALGTAALLLPAATLAGQDLPGPVVPLEWLQEHRDAPGVAVVQVGADLEAFSRAHIAGSRFLDLGDLAFSRGEYGEPGSVRLEVPAGLSGVEAALEAAGISDDSRVVIVAADRRRATTATRTLWTLQYLGLADRAGVLDGGLDAWRDAGLPVVDGQGSGPAGSFTARPEPGLRVDRGWMADNLETPGIAIVDGRRVEAYTGEREEIPGRAGHVPGAGNLPIEALFREDGRLRPREELRDLLAQAGVEAGDTVVAYCHIGLRATAVVLAARAAGYDAVLYDGSMVDWAMDRALPMLEGPDPR